MTTTPKTSPDGLTDTHDMVVVHRAFRREFRIIPELMRAVAPGHTARAAVIAGHARLCLRGLHLHHTSEDDLLWPKLLDRARPEEEFIVRMERQHEQVEELLERIAPALDRWEAEARPAVADEAADLFDRMRTALLEHLDDEEQLILPIAARHVTQEEWAAIGQAGVKKMKPAELPLMFGMVLEDADSAERQEMIGVLPAPVRLLMRTWGVGHYRRYVNRVRLAA